CHELYTWWELGTHPPFFLVHFLGVSFMELLHLSLLSSSYEQDRQVGLWIFGSCRRAGRRMKRPRGVTGSKHQNTYLIFLFTAYIGGTYRSPNTLSIYISHLNIRHQLEFFAVPP